MPGDPILELKNVHAGYGSIKALKGISLKVFPGEIVAMIGASLIAALIALDGESNWLEGVQLLSVYVIIALAFFFLPSVV